MPRPTTTRRLASRRRARGAVMVETVVILPFIMVVLVLIVYLGWNFRRMAQVTNVDRYAIWERATPGAPGPDTQYRPQEMQNPRFDNAFFGLTGDRAMRLDALPLSPSPPGYMPKGHAELRDRQADETYSYFDEFLDLNPLAIEEQFTAQHEHITESLELMGMSDVNKNAERYGRMNGDWRYVNGIRYDGQVDKWKPAAYRVSPGGSLREVFFAEMDDGLEPYDNSGNNLAKAIREFYMAYPAYRGPDVVNDSSNEDVPNLDSFGPSDGL